MVLVLLKELYWGSMLIGVIDAFGKALFPEIAMFTIYLAMIISLSIRPWGLLGKKVLKNEKN